MAAPTVTSLLPATGPQGITITVIGTSFNETTSDVTFGSYNAGPNFNIVSDTQLQVKVPAGTGTVSVRVTNSDGQSADTAADNFVYATYEGGSNSIPTVTNLAPSTSAYAYGVGGDDVGVTGTNFLTAKYVYFGSILATDLTIVSDTHLHCTAPPGTGTVAVSVENAYGTSVTTQNFTYTGITAPLLTDITPTLAYEGAQITLTGTNFIGSDGTEQVSQVTFYNGIVAEFRTYSATTIYATVPRGAANGVVTITDISGGTDNSASSFIPAGNMDTGVITGATTSDAYIEMAPRSGDAASIHFWAGATGEDYPGYILVQDTTGTARLQIAGVEMDSLTNPYIDMLSGTTENDNSMTLKAGAGATLLLDGRNASSQAEIAATADIVNVTGPTYIPKLPRLRTASRMIEHEFVHDESKYTVDTGQVNEFINNNVGNGLAAASGAVNTDHGAAHPGVIRFRSANSSTNSGRNLRTGGASFVLQNGDFMEFVAYFYDYGSYVQNRFGVMNNWTSADPSGGIWIKVVGTGSALTATGYVNSSYTSSNATLSRQTWYTLRVEVGSGAATFTAFTENGSAVTWNNNTVTATLPTVANAFGFVGFNTTPAANIYFVDMDYMGLYVSPRTR